MILIIILTVYYLILFGLTDLTDLKKKMGRLCSWIVSEKFFIWLADIFAAVFALSWLQSHKGAMYFISPMAKI